MADHALRRLERDQDEKRAAFARCRSAHCCAHRLHMEKALRQRTEAIRRLRNVMAELDDWSIDTDLPRCQAAERFLERNDDRFKGATTPEEDGRRTPPQPIHEAPYEDEAKKQWWLYSPEVDEEGCVVEAETAGEALTKALADGWEIEEGAEVWARMLGPIRYVGWCDCHARRRGKCAMHGGRHA
jgi:hypothetical protein